MLNFINGELNVDDFMVGYFNVLIIVFVEVEVVDEIKCCCFFKRRKRKLL